MKCKGENDWYLSFPLGSVVVRWYIAIEGVPVDQSDDEIIRSSATSRNLTHLKEIYDKRKKKHKKKQKNGHLSVPFYGTTKLSFRESNHWFEF